MCDHARFVTLLIRLPASQGVYDRISLVPKSYIPYIYIRSHDVQYNGFFNALVNLQYPLIGSLPKSVTATFLLLVFEKKKTGMLRIPYQSDRRM
jgi:hypothetical protein